MGHYLPTNNNINNTLSISLQRYTGAKPPMERRKWRAEGGRGRGEKAHADEELAICS